MLVSCTVSLQSLYQPSSMVLIVTDCFAISTSTSKISPSELCSFIFGICTKRRNVFDKSQSHMYTQKAHTHSGTTSMQILFVTCPCISAFCLRIAVGHPMSTPKIFFFLKYFIFIDIATATPGPGPGHPSEYQSLALHVCCLSFYRLVGCLLHGTT